MLQWIYRVATTNRLPPTPRIQLWDYVWDYLLHFRDTVAVDRTVYAIIAPMLTTRRILAVIIVTTFSILRWFLIPFIPIKVVTLASGNVLTMNK